MSIPIKVSELSVLNTVTSDDYIVINDSASVTTHRTSLDNFTNFLTGSNEPFRSASYALTSSYSERSSVSNLSVFSYNSNFSVSSSYASRSSFTTYVLPLEQLPANTINVIGTASWAASSSNLPNITFNITSSLSKTASYLYHDPNWKTTGVLNGTASYALSCSYASVAQSILGGAGISGTGNENLLTKWDSTGTNSPLVDSWIWEKNRGKIFFDNQNRTTLQIISESEALYSTFIGDTAETRQNSFMFVGGDLILTGSSGVKSGNADRGLSPKLTFLSHNYSTSGRTAKIYLSSSFLGGNWNNGSFVFETANSATEPWVFRSYRDFDQTFRDHVIITPLLSDTFIDISGSLWAHDTVAVGDLMSREGVGARLHISGSTSDAIPLLATQATDPNTKIQYLGLYVTTLGQVGIGTTQPQTRLETIESFSSNQYYVKDGTDYLRGADGTFIAFNTSDPNGIANRTYLTFKEGLLVNVSNTAPPLTQTVIPPVTPPEPTPVFPPTPWAGCPAIWQEIETKELGFVPAEKIEVGMHLRGLDGWNEVLEAGNVEGDIWRATFLGENFDVDSSHIWMVDKNVWRKVVDLKPGGLIYTSNGSYISIDDVKFLKRGLFRHIKVKKHIYCMGTQKFLAHNPGGYSVVYKE